MNSWCCPAQCVLCRWQSAHQVLVVVVPSLVISSSCARDCVFMTRDMLRVMAQEILTCPSRPTWWRSLCLFMETRLLVLENRLRQTEEPLVAERRASRRTAESVQQVVRTCPAGVDVEGSGRLEMFSGDSDLNSRVNSMPWSQWSLTVRSYFEEFDPVAAAGGNKRGRSDHRRQHDDDRSGERTFNTAVLCACTDLQEESAASGPTSSKRLRV